ncbi:MAG: 16S rRNA (cytidine(1402)-2'-O)-methyltransferase [Actinomycetes bacterium]
MSGALVVVATPIGNLGDLSPRAVEALSSVDVVACEDTRRTRGLLTHAGIPGSGRLVAVHAHNEVERAEDLVARMREGARVAYVSDAGTPGVSDPGARLVAACVAADIPVEVVPGASAVLAALVLSGFVGDRFAFEGFLPRRGRERAARLAAVAADDRIQILYEAPGRVAATVADLVDACGPDRPVAVAREITKVHEEVLRLPLAAAAAHLASVEARGEYVIVLGPWAPPEVEVDDAILLAAVRAAMAAGASRRDAAAAVAREHGVARRRVYELALAADR